MAKPTRLDEALDELLGLPLDQFTPARNELARQLKAAGDDDAAAEVRALSKPPVPVWLINQLSRREPKAVQALLDAGASLRRAQERGDRDALRAAAADERKAIERLVELGRSVLERPSAAVLERVAGTLRAAAVDEQGREALKAGRLTEELEPAGFEALAGFPPPARAPAPAEDELSRRRQEKQERERRQRELRERVRELERAALAAEREAEKAEDAADKAREAAERARVDADDARAELDAGG